MKSLLYLTPANARPKQFRNWVRPVIKQNASWACDVVYVVPFSFACQPSPPLLRRECQASCFWVIRFVYGWKRSAACTLRKFCPFLKETCSVCYIEFKYRFDQFWIFQTREYRVCVEDWQTANIQLQLSQSTEFNATCLEIPDLFLCIEWQSVIFPADKIVEEI